MTVAHRVRSKDLCAHLYLPPELGEWALRLSFTTPMLPSR